MAHRVKCPGCGETFDRDKVPFEHLKNRYWHKECYLNSIKNKSAEDTASVLLNEYICKLFETDYVGARVQKQIKDMVVNYKYSYSGILGTLKYWYEVKKSSKEKANGGIGIVPFVYADAKKHYETIFYSNIKNKDVKQEDFKPNEVVIRIKPPKSTVRFNAAIDFDELERMQLDE